MFRKWNSESHVESKIVPYPTGNGWAHRVRVCVDDRLDFIWHQGIDRIDLEYRGYWIPGLPLEDFKARINQYIETIEETIRSS